AEHQGSALVEIYQNCIIFNDRAFAAITDKEVRDEATVLLEQGKPLVFGKEKDKGIRLNGFELEVVRFADGFGPDDCLVWDATRQDPTLAFMVAQMAPPHFPTPIGVLRDVARPSFEQIVADQMQREIDTKGAGNLEQLFREGDVWTVNEDGSIS
ncbi:MAG TPA: 2-oxoacid:ferredoxin oxidoreductase subunit beta, partial [Thermoanaerobaculia bacterium]|nr:2-oxoacid:ferredoxin oxidoreductase subunit beta [Thermoanaerobaculia bacterium]